MTRRTRLFVVAAALLAVAAGGLYGGVLAELGPAGASRPVPAIDAETVLSGFGRDHGTAATVARLESELHAIAEHHYAEGPARAHAAYSGAEVEIHEAIVAATERELYSSMLGVEVHSGTIGEGSTGEFVCPGQPLDPRGVAASAAIGRSCPRKYMADGSAGLGLASRFPGYTQVIGRDRVRLARVLGWPSGDAAIDRRTLS